MTDIGSLCDKIRKGVGLTVGIAMLVGVAACNRVAERLPPDFPLPKVCRIEKDWATFQQGKSIGWYAQRSGWMDYATNHGFTYVFAITKFVEFFKDLNPNVRFDSYGNIVLNSGQDANGHAIPLPTEITYAIVVDPLDSCPP